MEFRKSTVLALGFLALAARSPRTLAADASVGLDIASAYVWRGITFNDGAVLQENLDVSFPCGVGLNVWGNFDLDDYDGAVESAEFSEIDLTASYAKEVGPVELGLGLIGYVFPNGGEGTTEIYVSVGGEIVSGLNCGVEAYYDFDIVEDFYAAASVAYEREITGAFSAEIAASAGLAGEDMSAGQDAGFHEYQITLSGAYAISETLEAAAYIAYVDGFDSDVLPEQDIDFYGGAGISYSF